MGIDKTVNHKAAPEDDSDIRSPTIDGNKCPHCPFTCKRASALVFHINFSHAKIKQEPVNDESHYGKISSPTKKNNQKTCKKPGAMRKHRMEGQAWAFWQTLKWRLTYCRNQTLSIQYRTAWIDNKPLKWESDTAHTTATSCFVGFRSTPIVTRRSTNKLVTVLQSTN